MNINYLLFTSIVFASAFCVTTESCLEEIYYEGIAIKWKRAEMSANITSEPLCFNNDELVTRECNGSQWVPELKYLPPCTKTVNSFNLQSCPPGLYPVTKNISKDNVDHCYEIGEENAWENPCFKTGAASIITDFDSDTVKTILNELKTINISKYFWLPARRQKLFNPVLWSVPGPKWGRLVRPNSIIEMNTTIFKNCLLLDVENGVLMTEFCESRHPSLCFYVNDLHFPATCPQDYHAFRFKPYEDKCLGFESSEVNLTFNEFVETKCTHPITVNNELTRRILTEIARVNTLPDNNWCWFEFISHRNENVTKYVSDVSNNSEFKGTVNNKGIFQLIERNTSLPCMACETNIIYGEPNLMFEFNDVNNQLLLTVYFSSGLWKYVTNDKGIQCFSDAEGFVKVVHINDTPFVKTLPDVESNLVEKIVYEIDLVTLRPAQYWCEAHTKNFTLLKTGKMMINPQGNKTHVFALVLNSTNLYIDYYYSSEQLNVSSEIAEIFNADNILLMDILECDENYILILIHIHVTVEVYDDETNDLTNTYIKLKQLADLELPKYNFTLVNISNSMYCLPTTSNDYIILDWELTLIGHISAPKQFCLQSNGLPVKRRCLGSYHYGAIWGEVEGYCDTNYYPSSTTTFLYSVAQRTAPENYTSHFLTDGLKYVLDDIEIIIPADIYYLSMSLQHIVDVAEENDTTLDMGDVENMAWAMDRIMHLNSNYLNLAQTLNSTNVILDSVSNIIEKLPFNNVQFRSATAKPAGYVLAVKPQFVLQMSYSEDTNISGILITKNSRSKYFSEMDIHPLYKNTSLNEITNIKHLEMATWVPSKVLNSLRTNCNSTNDQNKHNLRIIMTVHYHDGIFQEIDKNRHVVNSHIVGISIPGYISNLEHPIPLIFNKNNLINTTQFCGYWNFMPENSTQSLGTWARKGCYLLKTLNNLTICECYHLTHFSQLFNIHGHRTNASELNDQQHLRALNAITLVGSLLSLLGVIGIWITASIFQNWRKKPGTKVLLQLSTAIALPLIFIIVFNLDNTIFIKENGFFIVEPNMRNVCIALGAMLQYSILSSFMWMFITAILQFIRYVRVLGVCRPSRFMVKFSLVGWGIPLLPVIITLGLDSENYIPVPSDSRSSCICYPTGAYLIIGLIVPVSFILLINVIMFIIVLRAISRGPDGKMRTTDMDLIGAQLRLSIFLFFLLGLSWIFGILSFSNNLLPSYLFCLTSTIQGFVLFIYFVICDPSTRKLWITLMTPQLRSKTSTRNSIISISSS